MRNLFIAIVVLFAANVYSQNNFSYYIGIHPAITVEKFYDKGEFDLNIVPLVFQLPISKRMDIRLTSIYNYHFGTKREVSDVGFELASPIFLRKKESRNEYSHGFFISPVFGFGRNLLNEHNTLTTAAEAGYMFEPFKKFTVTLMLQFGSSYFMYANDENILRQHFGFKVNLGFWNLFD